MGARGFEPKSLDELAAVPNWEEIAAEMASQGASIVEILTEIGISRTTFYKRCKENTEVKEIKDFWVQLAESWYTKTGRINLANKDFQYNGYGLQMKNRFGWGEAKQQVDITSGGEKIDLPLISWVKSKD